MARITPLLIAVVSSFLSAVAFIGEFIADVTRQDYPPGLFDQATSLDADQVQRTGRMEVADSGSAAGAMFSERAHDHRLFIGDGFTYCGAALPI